MIAKRCFVSGRVQGVFYRASARARAVELGITGYARNLPDGRVEALLWGPSDVVDTMIEWLKRGPPAARVDGVEVREVPMTPAEVPADFLTR